MTRAIIGSILAGLLVAVAAALIIPKTKPATAQTEPTVALPDAAHPRTAPALTPPNPAEYGRESARGPSTLQARTKDPLGGPDWAIRVTDITRTFANRGAGVKNRCASLGRIVNGQFGWIDGTNTFRRAGLDAYGAPELCGSRTPAKPVFDVRSRVTDPTRPGARLIQTIAWGYAGPAGKPALTSDGHGVTVTRDPDGAFIAFLPTDHWPQPILRTTYGGRTVTTDETFRGQAASTVPSMPGAPAAAMVRLQPRLPRRGATATVQLRLPDPNGGLPWGVATIKADGGGYCATPIERLVGDRLGVIDFRFDTLVDAQAYGSGPCPLVHPGQRQALRFSWGEANDAGSPSADPAAGRVALRTLQGYSTIQGTADPDVVSITIATPRDTRTIVPAPHSHAFALINDGSFPAGRTTLTSRFKDGHTHTDTIVNASL